jgi:hypothetical protein
MMLLLSVLIALLFPSFAHALNTTYYVDAGHASKSDSNPGTSEDLPLATITACAGGSTPKADEPGDTCLVKNGTYTHSGEILLRYSGTAGSPITLKNYPGHTPVIAWSTSPSNSVSRIRIDHINGTINSVSYLTIEGFTITGHYDGIKIETGDHILITRNVFTTSYANGVLGDCWACTVSYNKFKRIGYHWTGTKNQIHGLYITGKDWLIFRNVFEETLGGYGIQTAGSTSLSGKPSTNHTGFTGTIANNTFAWGEYRAGIILWQSGTIGVRIENNIFYENANQLSTGANGIDCSSPGGNHIVRNNVAFATTPGVTAFTSGCSGKFATESGNVTTDPNFTTAGEPIPGSPDLTLTASSTNAINAGVAVTGVACNGTCDIGAFETIGGFSSATVNENNLDVTLAMSVNVPVIPTTTGWSVRVGGVARTVSSVNKLTGSDSVVRVTFSGAVCAGGETWDVSYAQTGATTDSALIGNTTNQELLAFTNQSVTNNCGAAPPSDPSTPYFHLTLDDGTSGTTPTTAEDESANNEDGTLTNGPTWVTGKHGSAVQFADQGDDSIAVAHGSGVNPSTQSFTVCMGVKMNTGLEAATRTYFGSSLGTNQRFFLSNITGTWSVGVQSSTAASNSDFPVTAGWHYVCLVMNSGTDVATLYVDAVAGTGSQSVKSYTSFTLASDVTFGRASGFGDSVSGGVTIDEPRWYNAALAAEDIADLYAIWEPTSPTPTGTYTQVAHQWQLLRSPETDYGAVSATVTVITGGAVSLVTQVDCTAADCDPTGLKLYYSCALCDTAGTWLPVPDTASGDGVAFFGTVSDSAIVTGTVACCLSGALTANDGTTQLTAAAVPNIDMAQNASFTRRSVLKFATDVTAGRTFCFQEYHQTGVALATPTPSTGACVTIASPAIGVGF